MQPSKNAVTAGLQRKSDLCIHHESGQEACLLEASVRFLSQMRQAESRQQALEILLEQSLEAFTADGAGVYELREDELVYIDGRGLSLRPPEQLPADTSSILGRALRSDKVLYFETAASNASCDFCVFFAEQEMQCFLLVPLRTTRTIVGVLFITLRRQITLSLSDQQLLSAFSEAAGNTLHRFQVMEQLKTAVANRDRELNLLYDLMAIAAETSETDQLLQACLKRIMQAVDCTAGVIHLIDPVDQKLKIAVSEQFPEMFGNFLEVTTLSKQLWTQVYRSQEIVQMWDLPDRRFSPETPASRGRTFRYLGVPIHIKGEMVGVLNLFGFSYSLLDSAVSQLASSAADVLGPALESVRLHKQAEDAVILHERQRLARNLHDSVSQSLYALVISADVSEKLLRIKDYPGLRQELRDIGKVALQGLKDMRLMLTEFRPTSLETVGLVEALEQRLNTVECRAGIDASLTIAENLDLSPQMEQEIYRIAIEALNNSLKHSEATRVVLSLHKDGASIQLEIRDNGSGFDPVTSSISGGMGLASMHERARILGGELTISSAPGQGTSIWFKAPLTGRR